jgi:branched-chain amino acid transport system substrate-binding protein
VKFRTFLKNSNLHEEYRSRYHKEPAAVTALGYDGYLLALDAITRANSADPVKIRDAIAKTSGFFGATGTVTLDAKSTFVKTVRDGTFAFNVSSMKS